MELPSSSRDPTDGANQAERPGRNEAEDAVAAEMLDVFLTRGGSTSEHAHAAQLPGEVPCLFGVLHVWPWG
jgi:hypothetical protein